MRAATLRGDKFSSCKVTIMRENAFENAFSEEDDGKY
jgi:hypothetical protein